MLPWPLAGFASVIQPGHNHHDCHSDRLHDVNSERDIYTHNDPGLHRHAGHSKITLSACSKRLVLHQTHLDPKGPLGAENQEATLGRYQGATLHLRLSMRLERKGSNIAQEAKESEESKIAFGFGRCSDTGALG